MLVFGAPWLLIEIMASWKYMPSSETTPKRFPWYLVYTKPSQENRALFNLERQGFECYLPLIRVKKIKRKKINIIQEPMFHRYLFLHLQQGEEEQSWAPIRSTLGVSSIVRFGTRPAIIDDEIIQYFRKREQVHIDEPLFVPGDTVKINDGPFTGLEAIFQSASSGERSIILLEILSRSVSIHIDMLSLRKKK